mgnify:CR=1 FL=1
MLGGMEKRDQLIEEYRKLVSSIARCLLDRMSLPIAVREDIESAGFLGLVEAADRFNPETGVPFTQFAAIRIRGAMIDWIRSSSHLTGRAYRMAKALKGVTELREEIELSSVEGVLEFAFQGALTFALSMSDVVEEVEALHDPSPDPEEELVQKRTVEILKEIVAELPEKERSIVELYYFHGKTFLEISHHDSALSKGWISRLHARALEMIREKLMEKGYA